MKVTLVFLFNLLSLQLAASHLLGGYISYRLVDGSLYEITVHLLTDQAVEIPAGDGVLDFGDGTSMANDFDVTIEEIADGVELVTFSVFHRYSQVVTTFDISYFEPNYNAGINNMELSEGTPFFISARIVNDISTGVNQSPVLKLFSPQQGLAGVIQRINAAAFDQDGDSLSYELIVPRQEQDRQIPGYSHPNDTTLYTNYNTGNQANDGPPVYSISPVSGEITWDAPELLGQYAIAYKIIQWREIMGVWQNIGENEVVLINSISDALSTVSITAPTSQCYNDEPGIEGRFVVEGITDPSFPIRVFSDLDGVLINNQPVEAGEILSFDTDETRVLEVIAPPGMDLETGRPYRVIVTIETGPKTVTSTWTFATNCDRLPGDIAPPLIIREETCSELVVYPNPSSGEIVEICVPTNTDRLRHVRIIDTTGKVMFEQNITLSTSILQLDTGVYPSGLYILQVDQSAWKFVVQR